MATKSQSGDIGGDVALVIWRMRRSIIMMSLLCFMLGILFAALSRPTYKASATVFLTDDVLSGGILGELSSLSSAPPAKAEMEVLRSRGIMDDAFKNAATSGIDLEATLDDLDIYAPGRILLRVLTRETFPESRFSVVVHNWADEPLSANCCSPSGRTGLR